MNILIVSQCDKRALTESRRILDQFAERRGDRTWQTSITQAGLDTLRRLLKKTARRNTSVACHWIRGLDHSELLWIVGDASRFNALGAVPTNTTARNVLRREDENDWHSGEDIHVLAVLAALFHDIGKANAAFQKKLRSRAPVRDAFRHEWVSLCLLAAFVGKGSSDAAWLERLAALPNAADDGAWLAALANHQKTPFAQLPPLAQVVGWLVVSHHRLPVQKKAVRRQLMQMPQTFDSSWCGEHAAATAEEIATCWRFAEGHLPFASAAWCERVARAAQAILARPGLLARASTLLDDPWILHLSRLTLMLADHHYSSLPSTSGLGERQFPAYANTDKAGKIKQRLDEHLLGVARSSRQIARFLPQLARHLPRLARHRGFQQRSKEARFRWQDNAFDLAASLREASAQQGFFGINMASTGCGKTLANGRIMYALADPQQGARFSIALGLRTLTLQTGQAYRERLHLGDDDLAVMVGGGAVRQLFEHESAAARTGSESTETLVDEEATYVHFEGSLGDGPLQHWLAGNPSTHKLVNAPILACTVDHLIPACESLRGGRQIAPMLRLLTSDVVLDEIDDFDLNDLPALSRLVHWAGLLGGRVLLSSATLPPALVAGLFEAYCAGRRVYQQNRGVPGMALNPCCAWFDEFGCTATNLANVSDFSVEHAAFVQKRVANLAPLPIRRRAEILPLTVTAQRRPAVCHEIAAQLMAPMLALHRAHHSVAPSGQRVSCGLIRMANIGPLMEVAQRLFAEDAPAGVRVHLCVYHSRFPLLVRSALEAQLDSLLNRADETALFRHPLVNAALAKHPEQEHLFVVLASPVAEVGRDHDYDWALVEPSSMRSLIQLAGRIRRHRAGECTTPNLLLWQKNVLGLLGETVAFQRPGFEDEKHLLKTHDLRELVTEEQLAVINASPRIVEPANVNAESGTRLATLEHVRLRQLLRPGNGSSSSFQVPDWWSTQGRATLSGVLQQWKRFRAGRAEQRYALLLEEEDADAALRFHELTERGEWLAQGHLLRDIPLTLGARVSPWGGMDYRTALHTLAESLAMPLTECAKRFGYLQLPEKEAESGWEWHPFLGFKRCF